MIIRIVVYGVPGPQGSKSFKGMRKGKPVLVESSKKVKPWRDAVFAEAVEAVRGLGAISGPVSLRVVFTLPAPAYAIRSKRPIDPIVMPDLSKLVRSTEDALTDAKVWGDDAQVVATYSWKTYPSSVMGSHSEALLEPGAVITITAL